MYTIPSAHPAHFLMAIVAACAISVSLTSMAAITGLVSNPTTSVHPPAFLKSLSSHLPGATPEPAIAKATAPVVERESQVRKTSQVNRRKHRTPAATNE